MQGRFYFCFMESLDALRKEIDNIDDQLADLLVKRMSIVKQIGDLKKMNNAIIYRPEREQFILDRLVSRCKSTLLNKAAIDAIFMEIFAASRNYELPEQVAYLGPEGSYSHQAAESRFGQMNDYIPLQTIRSVFESVATQRARFGVVPIENNSEGFVRETIDMLNEMQVKVVAEILLPIHLTFVSKSDKLSEIRYIYSREIAFKQCKKFLEEFFREREIELIPVESTSKAAKMTNEHPHSAAICSSVAAKLYRVPILYENIEDSPNNRTRFLIISKDFINQKSGNDKTIMIARLPDQVGSLANFLQDFNQQGINLNKIESRPLREGENFKNWFYIELDGHHEDENLKFILSKNRDIIRVLGSCVKLA